MGKYNSVYNRVIKRIIGFVLSLILLVVLLPVICIIALAVAVDSGFPVFYRAPRGGYRGKPFRIFKFRTMVKNADQIGGGTTALNDARITRVGRFLRKTKLDEVANLLSIVKGDEFPQLFNVLTGDMSFVGPRPELLCYTDNYDEQEQVIFQVRPGITDFSSLEYINLDEIVGEEDADEYYEQHVLKPKNQMRIRYAESVSFGTDVSLFFKTVGSVITKTLKALFVKEEKHGVHSS